MALCEPSFFLQEMTLPPCGNELTTDRWVDFWTLDSTPLIYTSVLELDHTVLLTVTLQRGVGEQ